MPHRDYHCCVIGCACVCFMSWLTVINYHSHAGDLLRLLITSQPRSTGGLFSCSRRDQLMPGDVFTGPCALPVYAHACVSDMHWGLASPTQIIMSFGATLQRVGSTQPVFSSLLSIGALMRRVFVLRTLSMVFQSSLLTVLEPSPLMKGERDPCAVALGTSLVICTEHSDGCSF